MEKEGRKVNSCSKIKRKKIGRYLYGAKIETKRKRKEKNIVQRGRGLGDVVCCIYVIQ